MPDIVLLYGGAAGDVLTDAASSASGVVFEIAQRALCGLPSSVDEAYKMALQSAHSQNEDTRALATLLFPWSRRFDPTTVYCFSGQVAL